MPEWLDPIFLIETLGLFGVLAIVFAESGLLFGFIFPGDSLLFSAGLLAAQGFLPIGWLLLGSFVAAALGDSVGYAFGHQVGPQIFSRPDSRWFKQSYLARTQDFYRRHGRSTIVWARFIPIVRTFAPILAGVGQMSYRVFLIFNVVGAAVWAIGVTALGYFFGAVVPNADRYLWPAVAVIILTSFLPMVKNWFVGRRRRP